MDTAIDDRRKGLHQPFVPLPGFAGRLLIQVHAKDQRRAELPRNFDELYPGGVLPQDVTDDQLPARARSGGHYALGALDRFGEWLLD